MKGTIYGALFYLTTPLRLQTILGTRYIYHLHFPDEKRSAVTLSHLPEIARLVLEPTSGLLLSSTMASDHTGATPPKPRSTWLSPSWHSGQLVMVPAGARHRLYISSRVFQRSWHRHELPGQHLSPRPAPELWMKKDMLPHSGLLLAHRSQQLDMEEWEKAFVEQAEALLVRSLRATCDCF